MGVTTGTATLCATSAMCTSGRGHLGDAACPVTHGTGKQQEMGILALGT